MFAPVGLKEMTVMGRFWASVFGGTLGILIAAAPSNPAKAQWLGTELLQGMLSSYTRWDGLYGGGHLGNSSMAVNFGNAASSEVAFILRNTTLEAEIAPSDWTTLPSSTTNSMQYGGFIGYNWQWNEAVIGLDVGYSRLSSMSTTASDSIARIVSTSDSVSHSVQIDSSSSITLTDYATLRARLGYAVGQFLPYAVVGGAVGRFNYATSATVTDNWTPSGGATVNFGPITQSDAKNDAFAAGFVVGAGMDVALLPNVFVRGEWEFTGFAPVAGIRTSIHAARVGAGIRF